ncbi:MAG: hypothetical protein JOZ73_01430 [Solirubrobacterales bacterium]|nr:hypothetical protein [Solirubrobacterales bacterium]
MPLASSATVGGELVGSDQAAAWLAGSGAHADLSPPAAGSGAFSLGLNFRGHVVGWPFPGGAAGRLTNALPARIRAPSGDGRCGVARLAHRAPARPRGRGAPPERRASPSQRMVCTASPGPLAPMLPAGALTSHVARPLRRCHDGMATTNLDYALSGPLP